MHEKKCQPVSFVMIRLGHVACGVVSHCVLSLVAKVLREWTDEFSSIAVSFLIPFNV